MEGTLSLIFILIKKRIRNNFLLFFRLSYLCLAVLLPGVYSKMITGQTYKLSTCIKMFITTASMYLIHRWK